MKKQTPSDDLELRATTAEDDAFLAAVQKAQAEVDAATDAADEEADSEEHTPDEERVDWGSILRSLVNGDFLRNPFVRRQVLFVMFVVLLVLLYTGNRYSSQQEIILIDSLKVAAQQEQYNVLTQSSELLNLMRQSNIEQTLKAHGDSSLINPIAPPFEIIPDASE